MNHPVLTENHPLWVSTNDGVFLILKVRKTIFQRTRHLSQRGGTTMQTYRVLLVEDKAIYRQYLEQTLHASERYTVVGIEERMEDALKFCSHTAVDLILTAAAEKNGNTCFSSMAECKKLYPHIRIVVMTDIPEHSYWERAEENGADSFWYTEEQQLPFLSVLDRTMKGESVFPGTLPSAKVGRMESRDFTAKELQILREVAKGDSNKEIAETLQMSYYTVRDYVKGMLEKTALPSRTALAAAAVGCGVIVLETAQKTDR